MIIVKLLQRFFPCSLVEVKTRIIEAMGIFKEVYDGYNFLCETTDPRLKGWPLLDSPIYPGILCISYFLLVSYGPRWMENRKAFELKPLLIVYNLSMVALNAYIVHEALFTNWLFEYSLGCQPVDYSNRPSALRTARYCWLFLISKYVELLDTVFFILRKKNNQVTYLHVFHHGTLPLFWWWGLKQTPGGFGTFHGLVNCMVHVVMYSYYGLTALLPGHRTFIWWKKYVTILQLTQFGIITIHNSQYLFMECSFPWQYVLTIQILTSINGVLFLNFYFRTYKKQLKDAANKKKVQSGSSTGKNDRLGVVGNCYASEFKLN